MSDMRQRTGTLFDVLSEPVDVSSDDPAHEQDVLIELSCIGVVRLVGVKTRVVLVDAPPDEYEGPRIGSLVDIRGLAVRSSAEASWGPPITVVDGWVRIGWYSEEIPQLVGLRCYPLIREGGAFRCQLRGCSSLRGGPSVRAWITLVLEKLR